MTQSKDILALRHPPSYDICMKNWLAIWIMIIIVQIHVKEYKDMHFFPVICVLCAKKSFLMWIGLQSAGKHTLSLCSAATLTHMSKVSLGIPYFLTTVWKLVLSHSQDRSAFSLPLPTSLSVLSSHGPLKSLPLPFQGFWSRAGGGRVEVAERAFGSVSSPEQTQ